LLGLLITAIYIPLKFQVAHFRWQTLGFIQDENSFPEELIVKESEVDSAQNFDIVTR